jgi:hypothetical protein
MGHRGLLDVFICRLFKKHTTNWERVLKKVSTKDCLVFLVWIWYSTLWNKRTRLLISISAIKATLESTLKSNSIVTFLLKSDLLELNWKEAFSFISFKLYWNLASRDLKRSLFLEEIVSVRWFMRIQGVSLLWPIVPRKHFIALCF